MKLSKYTLRTLLIVVTFASAANAQPPPPPRPGGADLCERRSVGPLSPNGAPKLVTVKGQDYFQVQAGCQSGRLTIDANGPADQCITSVSIPAKCKDGFKHTINLGKQDYCIKYCPPMNPPRPCDPILEKISCPAGTTLIIK